MKHVAVLSGLILGILLTFSTLTVAAENAGNSLLFNPLEDDYATIANVDGDLDTLNQEYTIEIWIYANSLVDMGRILHRVNSFNIHIDQANARIGFKSQTGAAPTLYSATNSIQTDRWHHIAVRRMDIGGGTYETSIFIDGAVSGTPSTDADYELPVTGVGDGDLTIGNRPALGRCFDGQLDELRLWVFGRPDTSIAKYRGKSLAGGEDSLFAYYRFDEALDSQILTDATGNGYDGTLGANTDPGGDVNDPAIHSPSLAPIEYRLVAPDGAVLNVGDPLTVRWAVDPTVALVNVQVSLNNGTSWLMLALATANDGAFDTYVPGMPGGTALFRVENSADISLFDNSDAACTILNPGSFEEFTFEAEDGVITELMHVGSSGTAFECGFIYSTWSDSGTATFELTITKAGIYAIWGRLLAPGGTRNSLWVSVDGGPEALWDIRKGTGDWHWDWVSHRGPGGIPPNIADIDPWLVPLAPGDHELVVRAREHYTQLDRIVVTNDLTARPRAYPKKWLKMTSPKYQDVLYRTGTWEITWGSQNISDLVTIEISFDDGETWPDTIAYGTANDGSFLWTIPDYDYDYGWLRISDGLGETCPRDESIYYVIFEDPPPELTVVFPNGGEKLFAKSDYDIWWTSTNFVGLVDIEVSLDNGENWTTLATNRPASGTFSWLIPDIVSEAALIRISDAAGSGLSDTSDGPFTIVEPTADFALSFDGVDDFVEIANDASLNIAQSFTIEFWIKTSDPYQNNARILEKGSWDEYAITTYGNTGKVVGALRMEMPDGSTRFKNSVGPTTTVLHENSWYHIAATYDGDVTRIYVNGVEESFRTVKVQPRQLLGDLIIGAVKRPGRYESHLNGVLDELRIWNIPRTEAEIAGAMNSGLSGTETGLVAYYPLNEGSGQIAGDASSLGNHGRLGLTESAEDSDPTWVVNDRPKSHGPFSSDEAMAKSVADAVELSIPAAFELLQNYPNPFNAGTTISFTIPSEDEGVRVTLQVFDVQGRVIRTLADNSYNTGSHQVLWDGRTDSGEQAASGLYFYRILAGQHNVTKRMILLK